MKSTLRVSYFFPWGPFEELSLDEVLLNSSIQPKHEAHISAFGKRDPPNGANRRHCLLKCNGASMFTPALSRMNRIGTNHVTVRKRQCRGKGVFSKRTNDYGAENWMFLNTYILKMERRRKGFDDAIA